MDENFNYLNTADKDPKKRILFIITQSEMGGAQKFVFEIVSRLNKEKYNTLVAAGSDGGGEFLKQLDSVSVQHRTINSLKRNISPIHDLKAIFEIRKLIKDYKPHTIFLNSSKAGFIGSLVSKFMIRDPKNPVGNLGSSLRDSRFKIIYRIGGWSFNDPGPKWKKLFWISLERLSARWKDIIIVNNKHDFDQAKRFKIKPRNKVQLVYNGLDVYKINFMDREEARLKLFEKAARQSGKIFNAETIIGTIANFYPSKGLEHLIETAEHFKNDNVVFVIIGEGIERPRLEKLIIEKGLRKKVLLLGQINDALRFLPAFDIFILSSIKEGFPWVVVEAMAAKLPVIATRVGAIPEIIEDTKNGMLVEPARPEHIAKKIQELLDNDHLRREIGIQAHQTVLFKFPLDKMIREIESIMD